MRSWRRAFDASTVGAITLSVMVGMAGATACSSFGADEGAPDDAGGGIVDGGSDGTAQGDAPTESGSSNVTTLATGQKNISGLAVSGDTAFWSEKDPGVIHSVGITSGAILTIASPGGAPGAIVATPAGIAWADEGAAGTITLADFTGGNPVPRTPNFGAGAQIREMTLVGDLLAITTSLYNIHFLGVTGSPTTQGPYGSPFAFSAVGNMLYWTESSARTVWRGDSTNAKIERISDVENDCQSIAASSWGIFWANYSIGLVRARLSAGGLVTLAPTEDGPYSLMADGDAVYWLTRDGKLRAAGKNKDKVPLTVAEGFTVENAGTHAHLIGLTPSHVVWAAKDKILRIPR